MSIANNTTVSLQSPQGLSALVLVDPCPDRHDDRCTSLLGLARDDETIRLTDTDLDALHDLLTQARRWRREGVPASLGTSSGVQNPDATSACEPRDGKWAGSIPGLERRPGHVCVGCRAPDPVPAADSPSSVPSVPTPTHLDGESWQGAYEGHGVTPRSAPSVPVAPETSAGTLDHPASPSPTSCGGCGCDRDAVIADPSDDRLVDTLLDRAMREDCAREDAAFFKPTTAMTPSPAFVDRVIRNVARERVDRMEAAEKVLDDLIASIEREDVGNGGCDAGFRAKVRRHVSLAKASLGDGPSPRPAAPELGQALIGDDLDHPVVPPPDPIWHIPAGPEHRAALAGLGGGV